MKGRNRNKTHQQRFQGRHDQPQPVLPEPDPRETHASPDHNPQIEREQEKEHGPARAGLLPPVN